MIAIDANILFYSGDESEPERMRRSAALLTAAAKSGVCAIPLQAIGEFAHAAARKGLLDRTRAAGLARDFAATFPLLTADRTAFRLALDWWTDGRLSYWDALLVATAATGGATALASEDLQNGAVIGGVEIINPFSGDAPVRLAAHGLAL